MEAVHVQLQRGRTIKGELLSPDGQPAKSAVMICSGRVGPIFPSAAMPIDVKDGRFVLSGCEEGHEYSVVFLDSAHDCGAVATLPCSPGAAHPRIQLKPCGKAKVRIIDPASRPIKGALPHLFLRVPRSIRLDEVPTELRRFDFQECVRVDPVYNRERMLSDGDGCVELRGLIPGVTYQLSIPHWPKQVRSPFVAPTAQGRTERLGSGAKPSALTPPDGPRKMLTPFTVRPAEVRTLPNIIVERQAVNVVK